MNILRCEIVGDRTMFNHVTIIQIVEKQNRSKMLIHSRYIPVNPTNYPVNQSEIDQYSRVFQASFFLKIHRHAPILRLNHIITNLQLESSFNWTCFTLWLVHLAATLSVQLERLSSNYMSLSVTTSCHNISCFLARIQKTLYS